MGKRVIQLVSLLVFISGCLFAHPEKIQAVTDFSKEYYTDDGQYIYMNEYDWYIGDGSNQYALYQYMGSETVIRPPEEINGVPVVKLGDAFLSHNDTVQEVYVPKSIEYIVDTSGASLKKIEVAPENTVFFSEEGVLYRRDNKDIALECYPRNHSGEIFVVPDYVTRFSVDAIFRPDNLKTIIINDNVQHMSFWAIRGNKKVPLDIYLNMADPTKVLTSTDNSLYELPDGSRVFVKNEEARQAVQKIFDNTSQCKCGSVEVISMSEHPEYAVPAESLVFKDGTTEQAVTMSPGDGKALYGIFDQLPSNCTENITWESSSPNIVSVETGSFSEDGQNGTGIHMEAKNCGECDVVGTNESGMQLVYHVKVSEPVSSLRFADERDLVCYSLKNFDSYSKSFDFDSDKFNEMIDELENQQEETAQVENIYRGELVVNRLLKVYIDCKYYSDAGNPGYMVSFSSSNPAVARVESSGQLSALYTDYESEGLPCYRQISAKLSITGETGEAEITAAVTDGWNHTFRESFTVTVEEDPFEGNCTRYVELEDFDINADGNLYFSETAGNFGVNNDMCIGRAYRMEIETSPDPCSAALEVLRQKWSVGDPGTAQIVKKEDGSWYLTMLKAGSTTLTVTVYDGDKEFRKTYPVRTGTYQNGSGTNMNADTNPNPAPNDSGSISQNASGTDTSVNGGVSSGSNAQEQKQPAVTVKQTSVKSVKASGKKALTVKWKKVPGARGYQVQAAVKKSFKSAKKVTVKKGNVTAARVKGLKSGKKYYVRVRAYRTVNGKTVYEKWSKVKTCKTK